MFKLILILCFIISINCLLYLPSLAQDKCSNSTDYYLCDPSFENKAVRDGSPAYLTYKSHTLNTYPNTRSFLNINYCLGGPITNNDWVDPYHWFFNGPQYQRLAKPQPNPPYWVYEIPEFLSWYQPTLGPSNYFHTSSMNWPNDLTMRRYQVWVPTNFAGYQVPEEGNGYTGILIAFDNHGTEYKQYLQAPLKNPLIVGNTYRVSFKVSHGWDNFSTYHYQSLKQVCALFTAQEVTYPREQNLYSEEGPQVWKNNQDQVNYLLSDSTDWMTVEQTFRVRGENKNYITIGNFQSVANMKADIEPKLNYTGKLLWGAYYYIDDINISQVAAPDPCYCDLHDVEITPNTPASDNQCCYTIKVKSDSATCFYNMVKIFKGSEQTGSEYTNTNGYIRDGQTQNIITTNYCFTRPQNGDPIYLRIVFIHKNFDNGQIIDSCAKTVPIRCNCECRDIGYFAHNGGNNEIKVFAKRVDSSCCFDLFILNESKCQIPYNKVKLFYNSSNFQDLTLSSTEQGWSSQIVSNTITFTKSNPAIIPQSSTPLKIATICVSQNGVEHNFTLKLGNDASGWCDEEWSGSFQCFASIEDCCDNFECELVTTFDTSMVSSIFPRCCWNLKVSENQVLNCPIITKMEVFNQSNLSIPVISINNPVFNNSSGNTFAPSMCIYFPGWDQGSGPLTGSLDIKVRFWVGNNVVCEKDLSEECTLTNNEMGDSKKGDFSINNENTINLDNITIKPNPFSDKTTIEFTLDKEEFVSLEVYNSIGDRLSALVSSSLGKGLHKQILDGESYPNGAYYLKFTHGDKSVTIPIVKIK